MEAGKGMAAEAVLPVLGTTETMARGAWHTDTQTHQQPDTHTLIHPDTPATRHSDTQTLRHNNNSLIP